MKDFSRYFTPVLTHEERSRIGKVLGLNDAPWGLEESCGGQILRRWKSSAGPCWAKPEEESEFDFGSLGPHLKISSFREPQALWRELLPFPFRALPEEGHEARTLGAAWAGVESQLAAFELSLVWVGDADRGIALLFHFVRRRCVRLGTTESLNDIGKKCLLGEWESSDLQAHFGTRTGFFRWEPGSLTGNALDRLVTLFQRTQPTYVPEGAPLHPPSGL